MRMTFAKLFNLLALVFATGSVWADPVWIDVRTVEEYSSDHIEGDTNIPLAELDAAKLATIYDKDAEIMLYCRSGNRAGQARQILEAAGFTNVSNAGGIGDVRELRELAATAVSGATAATAGAASGAGR
jgi:phage shock protein E